MSGASYTISIATHISSDDYEDTIEVSYPCGYSCENGVHRLKYNDDEAGLTVVKILPDRTIEIRRKRSFTIIMKEGFSHSAECETDYGSIPMTFTLLEMSHSLSEDGGILQYSARVGIDGQPQINRVKMLLTPSAKQPE